MRGLLFLHEETRELTLFFSLTPNPMCRHQGNKKSYEDTARRQLSASQEESLHWAVNLQHLNLGLPRLRNHEK